MKSEAELRALTDRSQEDGFKAIFNQYSGYVYAIVWNHIRTVGTREDAEETVSDVFADLFRDLSKIEEGKLESYIRTLAKRTAVDTFRRLAARHETSLDEEERPEPASDEDIEAEHDRTALRDTLLRCIRSFRIPSTRRSRVRTREAALSLHIRTFHIGTLLLLSVANRGNCSFCCIFGTLL